MKQQLASASRSGWNRALRGATARPGFLHRILRRLGLERSPDFAHTTVLDSGGQPARMEHEFFRSGEEILDGAREVNQPVCVLVLELHDLPELEHVFGSKLAQQVTDQTLAKLKQVSGRKGLAQQTGAATFAAVVPNVWLDGALEAFYGAFTRSCCIEVEAAGEEIVLVPDFKIQSVRENGSIQITYDILRREIALAREKSLLRLEYLQRERASHSKPMHLRAGEPRLLPSEYVNNIVEKDLQERDLATSPATMPVELGRG